tara:strand:+ start:288 stop:1001 length:714 start_codon:yes stop_codon:yes gene_type:complete
MLSWSLVLERIRDEMSLPDQFIEKTDAEVQSYCTRTALRKFSTYFPSVQRIAMDTADNNIKVQDGRQNEYFLNDADGLEILGVSEFIPTQSNLNVLGHPYIAPFDYEGIPDFALSAFKSMNAFQFSDLNPSLEFIPPNRVRMSSLYKGRFVIQYERMHHSELNTVPNDLSDLFTDLCIAMVKMWIGNLRKRYPSVQTPFGEINISGEDLYSTGKELYDSVMEEMKTSSYPPIIFDRG